MDARFMGAEQVPSGFDFADSNVRSRRATLDGGEIGGVRDPEEGGGGGGEARVGRCRSAGARMCAGGAWRGRFWFGEGGLARVVRRGVLGLGVEGRCCAWVGVW